jgi:AraC-like DNA-binding protein
MLYLEHRPAAPLSLFIEAIWYTRGYNPGHSRERVLPNGTIQLIISLAHDHIHDCGGIHDYTGEPGNETLVPMPPSLIAGVHSGYMVINTADLTEMMGIQFLPGGAVPFFAVPADKFSNTHVSLEAVWANEARDLRDRLREASTPQGKFAAIERAMERALLTRANNRFVIHPAIDFAIRQFQSPSYGGSVGEVTHQIGLSPRRFAQIFREQVGVTPKLYCRIRRFQQAVRRMSLGRDVNWADLALRCGYFDQSHFANDFRAFSGINPTAYVDNCSQWMNHVAL